MRVRPEKPKTLAVSATRSPYSDLAMFFLATFECGAVRVVYGVFEARSDAEALRARIGRGELREIEARYPILFVQRFDGVTSVYEPMTSPAELDAVFARHAPSNDEHAIHFNVFVIRRDTMNEAFPGEPCLRGATEHYHVQSADLRAGAQQFFATRIERGAVSGNGPAT